MINTGYESVFFWMYFLLRFLVQSITRSIDWLRGSGPAQFRVYNFASKNKELEQITDLEK